VSDHTLGQVCALATAITWAFAVVLFKRVGDRIPPLPLNLFKNVVGVILLALTLLVVGDGLSTLMQQSLRDILILTISGILGIAVADTLFFHALNRCGVGLMSIVDCTYSPFTMLFSFLMLGEKLNGYHYGGGGLILLGIFTASRHAPPPGRSRRDLIVGMLLGATAMALMACGIVMAKPVLTERGFPLLWAVMIRMLFGTLLLSLTLVNAANRDACLAVFRPSKIWWTSIPAAFIGAYVSMVLWVAGFKYTKAGLAAILNQTSVIFALLLAAVVLHEKLTPRKLIAVTLALTGVIIIVTCG
jgi:drug/metabolite transporter (DMT)-like permease